MQVTRWAFVAVTSAMLGCGGGGDGGTTNPPPPPPPPPPPQTLASISTNVTSMNLAAGNTQQITVSAIDTQGAPILNITPAFTVTGATFAEVDNTGTVLGLSTGSATVNVSVTHGAVTRTASVAVTVTGTLPSQATVSAPPGTTFNPNKVAIARGGQVTWSFGSEVHNVTFATGGAPANINNTSGSQESRTFTNAGNFLYNCTQHPGMSGQVIVR